MVDPPGSSGAFAVALIVIGCYYLIYTPMQYVGESYVECRLECPRHDSISCTSSSATAHRCQYAGCDQCIDRVDLRCYAEDLVCENRVSLANTSLLLIALLVAWGLLVVYAGYFVVWSILHGAGLA